MPTDHNDIQMTREPEVLGYYENNSPVIRPKPGSIVAQAFILCHKCGKGISPVDGPAKALCMKCMVTKLLNENAWLKRQLELTIAERDDLAKDLMYARSVSGEWILTGGNGE